MKKICSKFFVVERSYWTFGLNILSNLSKLPPMGAANVLSFFGEKSNCLVIFGFWAKVTNFWQKNSGKLLKVLFTCPQQNFEEKWWKWFILMTSFLGLWVSFFWFWQKNSQVCRNSNLTVHRKIVIEKTLEQLVFSSFFGLWQKKPVFLPESFWQCCQNYFLRVQRKTYRATFLKGSLENFRTFG